MCGIVGLAGALAFKDEATLKRLLLLDYLRGPDSTGLAAIRNTKEVKIAKTSSNPIDLFDMSKFKDALNGNLSRVFLGHNRAATRGEVNTANAHPYQYGSITGCHNGTLDHNSVKDLEKELGETFAVDSQAIFAGIAKMGLKDTFSVLSGAWSIVYYDSEDDTLNFLRNKERPMWYAWTKEFDRLIWASEHPMIEAAVQLGVGYELFVEETKDHSYNIWPTAEDTHYKFDVGGIKAGGNTRPKPVVKTIKGKEAVAYEKKVAYDPFDRHENVINIREDQTSTGKTSKMISSTSGGTGLSIRHVLGDLRTPLAGFIDRDRFDELAKFGCSWCQADVEFEDAGVTIYDRDDILLCSECSKGDKASSRIYVKNPQMSVGQYN